MNRTPEQMYTEMHLLMTDLIEFGRKKGWNECKEYMQEEGRLHNNPEYYQAKIKESYSEGYDDGYKDGYANCEEDYS